MYILYGNLIVHYEMVRIIEQKGGTDSKKLFNPHNFKLKTNVLFLVIVLIYLPKIFLNGITWCL